MSKTLSEVYDEILGPTAVKTAEDFPPPTNLDEVMDHACAGGPPYVVLLKKLAGKKYQLILAYIHYGDQLRAMYRDGLYTHFQEHLEEERAQLYQINKKITALGDDAPCDPAPVPQVPLDDAKTLLTALLQLEKESVEMWSELFRQTANDVALNGLAQNFATECQGHADDMKRYLRSHE